MNKSLISIGFEIPGHPDKSLSLSSDQSLLDYDIIIFRPDISEMYGYGAEPYQGKLCLSDDASFNLRQKAEHWRQDLINAYDSGKTIFIFLSELQEVFVAAGLPEPSSEGRSRVTTRHVDLFQNYRMIPISFEEVNNGRGREMKPTRELNGLSPYWTGFKDVSRYQVHFSSKMVAPLFGTKSGNKAVGGIVRGKVHSGKGAIILLPELDIDDSKFTAEKNGETFWNKKGVQFGNKLISTLVEIDNELNTQKQRTPTPDWATSTEFRLQKESVIENQIIDLSTRIESLQARKHGLFCDLEKEASLKRLLYESGPALEAAILDALDILGLEARRDKDAESEFDAVFTWSGKRFLGEAKGEDSQAIDVDKISQLERNLSEDYASEGVTEYAKGILFGNAFRLQELSGRNDYFSEKCIATAKRIKAALVRTPDLFFVARYAKESGDAEFSKKCVEAILAAEGTVVDFPSVPARNGKIVIKADPKEATDTKNEVAFRPD